MTSQRLRRIENRLLSERERATRALERARRNAQEQADAQQPAFRYGPADQGTAAQERETAILLASKEGRYLYRIEDALRRLRTRPEDFGRCRECHAPIPYERLEALPYVRTCLTCKVREEAVGAA